jgi:hypothetical protein
VQQDPNSVSKDEKQKLESAIGTKSTGEILTGKKTSWVPEFKGISAQLWGDSGQVAPIQAKLTIGEVGDKYEQEADRVAKDVVQRINTPSTQTDTLQRQETEEELQLKEASVNEIVQRQEATDESEVSTDLESAINSAKGSGQPLDKNLQQSMGQAIGADFSGVRIHTHARSDRLNRSIQAKAFTTGQDVFFRQGEYQPGNREGQELIAHELTHVVQQKGSAVQQKPIQKNGELEARLNCKNEIAWQSTKKTSYLMTGNNRLQAMTYVTGIKSFQNQAKNYKNRTWDINHFHGWLVKIKEANQDKFPELVYEQLEPKDMAKLVKGFSTYVDENGIDGLEIEKPKEKYVPPVIGLFEDLTLGSFVLMVISKDYQIKGICHTPLQ